jgi:flagellar biosynthetic protein FliR
MAVDNTLSISTLLGFLLTLVRVASVFVFVPVPGLKSAVDPARLLLIFGVAIALFPVWPHPSDQVSAGLLASWIASESALGLGIGLAVAFAIEAFLIGAQVISLQAGYSFASTVDPATQADSGVLIVFAQTAAALLFFAMGLDREVLRVFARSMETVPAGTFLLSRAPGQALIAAGSTMFSTGLRLALPVIAVLIMADISLALLGRVNSQLHLLAIAFPVKMFMGLCILGWLATLLPALMRGGSSTAFAAVRSLITH